MRSSALYNVLKKKRERDRPFPLHEHVYAIKCESEERVLFYHFTFHFSLTLVNLRYLKSAYRLSVELLKQKCIFSRECKNNVVKKSCLNLLYSRPQYLTLTFLTQQGE